jgi:exonuclease III
MVCLAVFCVMSTKCNRCFSSFPMAESINILNWNVRGLNSPAKRQAVREMVCLNKPKLVCLQETKLQQITKQIVVETLGPGLDGFSYLPANGSRGGILCGRRSDCVATAMITIRQFSISMDVQLKWYNSSFLLTTVYGPVDDADRPSFLSELSSIKPMGATPWIVMGDFNLIYEASDKNNLNLNRRLMGQFRRSLDDCDLIEFSLQNRRFTWSNERVAPTLVRLDWVFCNKEWDLKFSGYTLQALSSSVSDHCPLFLCQQARPKQQQSFRFETF